MKTRKLLSLVKNSGLKLKSFLPPFHISVQHDKHYIVVNGDWIEVDRDYTWQEIEPFWERAHIEIKSPVKLIKKTFTVNGSKGLKYKVTNIADKWTCNCPSFTFSRGNNCKHIKSIINTI